MTTLEQTIKITAEYFRVPVSSVSASTHYLNDLGSALADEGALIKQYNDAFGTGMTTDDAEGINTVGGASEWLEQNPGQ